MDCQVILVVEDEVLIRMLMADVLRDEGYRVIEAATGDEAMAILNSGQTVDLVVTDVRMPGEIDGVELAARSKAIAPLRPVVIVSGHLPPAAAVSADAFLPKPYVPSVFMKVVVDQVGAPCQGRPRDLAG